MRFILIFSLFLLRAGVSFSQVSTSDLEIVKTVSPSGPVMPGDVLTYTITVTNTGDDLQENIVLTDPVPAGTTYVSGSTTAYIPPVLGENASDDFSSGTYSGFSGNLNWVDPWVEVSDDDSANWVPAIGYNIYDGIGVKNGRIEITYMEDSWNIGRSVDLQGYSNASLSFTYESYLSISVIELQISSADDGPWETKASFTGSASGTYTVDLTSVISSNTTFRFISGSGKIRENYVDPQIRFAIDDVVVSTPTQEAQSLDNSGGTTMQLVDGVAANLVVAGDGVDLAAGETVTVTFQAEVDDDVSLSEIVNEASVTSDLVTTPVTDSVTNEMILAVSVGNLLWFDSDGDGVQDATESYGITNVPVYLVDSNDLQVGQTITDDDGLYLFEGVWPGIYHVEFDLSYTSGAWVVVTQLNQTDEANDSDGLSGAVGDVIETEDFVVVSGVTNLNVDVGLTYAGATRAEVAEVWGEWRGDRGYIVWETGSEWNTAGFFVYRIDRDSGDETRLNDALIPSAFFAQGSGYEWIDGLATEGGSSSIRLEEVELSGTTLDLGTYEVTFAEPRPEPVSVLAAPMAAVMAVEEADEPSDVLKLFVRDAGLVGVSLQTIADGMGREWKSIEDLAMLNQLRLTCQGESVPTWFDSERGRLVFFGEATDNWYARDAAYLLSEGAGLEMPRREPGATAGENHFPVTLRTEEDGYTLDSVSSRPDDFYYWNYILSENATLGQHDYDLDLTGFVASELSLTVCLRGWSESDREEDHHAEFYLNGSAVGEVFFDDKEVVEASLVISADLVKDGLNTLTVKGVLPEEGTVPDSERYSYFVLDWIDASFDRQLVPREDGSVIFSAGTADSVSADSFVEPIAVAWSDAGLPELIAPMDESETVRYWQTATSNEQFAVVEADDLPMLETDPAAETAWFLSETNQIDYLVITASELESTAHELATYREEMGLRVGVATFEDICDLMTHGLRTPEAIPALLRYAHERWESAPWMVVLAGNGHYDYLNAQSSESNWIPPMLQETHDGLFAADGLLGDLDGDSVPDLAIGRLPALTADDLSGMIDKIKAYEAQFGSEAGNQLVFASDVSDAAGDFDDSNEAMAQLAGQKYSVEEFDVGEVGATAAHNQLMTSFNDGVGFIHYTGHAGMQNISSKNILNVSDVSEMESLDSTPILVALSCLVGRYEVPDLAGMGETLMQKEQGGAVAIWSPSGLSRNAPAVELGAAFYDAVLQQGCGTLGLAIFEALSSLDQTIFNTETLSMYNLLGDPALRIAGNTAERSADDSFAKWKWQQSVPGETSTDLSDLFEAYIGGSPELNLGSGELSWSTDSVRSDVDYQIMISTNLVDWEAVELDVQIVDAEMFVSDIQSILEREEIRLYIKLKAVEQ